MQLPLTISLHPSRFLALLLIVAHGLVAASLAGLAWHARAIAIWPIGVLLFVVLLSVRWQWRYGFGSHRCVELILHPANAGRWSLTLLPDALSGEDFRRLRLWLRWRADADWP